jgi:hypothetical protein
MSSLADFDTSSSDNEQPSDVVSGGANSGLVETESLAPYHIADGCSEHSPACGAEEMFFFPLRNSRMVSSSYCFGPLGIRM